MTCAPTAMSWTTIRPAPRANAKRAWYCKWRFLGGMGLWLVQLAATALYAKLLMGTFTFGG